MRKIHPYFTAIFSLVMSLMMQQAVGQNSTEIKILSDKQKGIVLMAAFAAKGAFEDLKTAINQGLNAGLTINECKKVFLHAYAYCGFPRSIQGLNTLIVTLNERKAKGIQDSIGRAATPVDDTNKYETGWKNLAKLQGRSTDGPIEKPKSGYGAFSPEIDRFLKEHLFADLFSRDVLTFAERELTTISVLIVLGKGVEPMLGSHLGLTMKQGVSRNQIEEVFSLVEKRVSKEDADAARKVFSGIASDK
jgi:alkylhydroperoxidase/carboxymuconolactone decarboxylase family protein YurZ